MKGTQPTLTQGATLGAAIGMAVFLLASVENTRAATNGCGNQAGPYFAGVTYNEGVGDYTTRGAKSKIDVQHPDLCTNQGNTFSNVWAMVASTDANGYAQIGYHAHTPGGIPTLRYFYQWKKSRSVATTPGATYFWGTPEVGAEKTFKVERLGTTGHLHMFLAGSEAPCNPNGGCAETTFDPLVAWDGMQAQWQAEVGWPGSDVVGVVGDKVNVEVVGTRLGSDWSTPSWSTVSSDRCYYHASVVNDGAHFRLWTGPLDHDC